MKTRLRLACLSHSLVLLLLACGLPSGLGPSTAAPVRSNQPPNIIFILTDDQDTRSIETMPRLKSLLIDHGTTFSNFLVNVSLCCPSRASILRGQYAHNHQVFTNTPPKGGFKKFQELGQERSTVASWLEAAGYRTALFGKYLNGYAVASGYVPPGWSEWYGMGEGPPAQSYTKFQLIENGLLVDYGGEPENYITDKLTTKAVDFIQRVTRQDRPFFMYIGHAAPHSPSTPAPRHEDQLANATAPQTPSFDEADVRDKPLWVRQLPRLSRREMNMINERYRKRLQSLLAVDEQLDTLMRALDANGQLDNT